tara:strand:- start:2022 stop:2435 length:414 start_codon:yes stop_codon:yes gene_type:complete
MEDTSKIVTLASFVLNEKIESFKNYLYKRFNISGDKIFIYKIIDEPDKKIITFRVYTKEDKKINLHSFFPTTIIIHKKGECFYTINALNRLIEHENGGQIGNINYKKHQIDWDTYQGKMLITKRNELIIMDIERNFS